MSPNLEALAAGWRAKADDYLRISKAYNCRANEALRTAYIKQAAQLRMCADELEEADAEAMAQGTPAPEADGQALAQAEGADTAEGQIPMPALPRRRTHTRGNRGGSHPAAVEAGDGQASQFTEPVR